MQKKNNRFGTSRLSANVVLLCVVFKNKPAFSSINEKRLYQRL
jgi:hypothetical protein